MSTRKEKTGKRLYHVGVSDAVTHGIFAYDAKGAVREFCEDLTRENPQYWDDTFTLEVFTRQQGTTHWWHVDASQPPAWIIERME